MSDKSSSPRPLGDLPPIKIHRPNLDNVPKEIADRIIDMWRVESMLSQFAFLAHERASYRKALRDTFGLARQIVVSDETVADKMVRMHEFEMTMGPSSFVQTFDQDLAIVEVNQWVSASDQDCHRLGCEASIIYLQKALQPLHGNDAKWWRTHCPLVFCLRRLRNWVLHFRPLGVSERDFAAQSTLPQRDGTPLRLHFGRQWFLEVRSDDLADNRGENVPDMFRWFENVCRKYPASYIVQAAVEQVCEYFDTRAGGTI